MAATIIGYPLSLIVDGVLSYLQWAYGNTEIIPPEYRWSSDDRESHIRICAPFVIDNEKPMSAPYIVVERTGFNFANQTLDNLKSQSVPDGTITERVDWIDGGLNITFGSGVASEASNLANMTAMLLQADRHGICAEMRFVRSLKYISIGPEMPIVKYDKVHRWEVTLQIFVSIQLGWIHRQTHISPWNSVDIINQESQMFSEYGETTHGSSLLIDNTKDFGTLVTNDPQLLTAELTKGWYYIRFSNNTHDQLYTIKEIVDNHTLRLATHNHEDDETAWRAPETATGLSYDLLWNTVHVHVKIPGAN